MAIQPGFFDVQSLFGAPQLIEAIQARRGGTPKPLPESFYTSRPGDSVIRDSGEQRRRYSTQQNAAIQGYGEAARQAQMVASEMVPIKLVHAFEKISIKMTDFVGILKKDSTGTNLIVDEKGVEYIGEQISEFQTKFLTLRNTITGLALATDTVYIGINGNILPTSTGSSFTISSGVPANNQGQLNGIISASWANSATDIPAQIRALQRQAAQDFAGDGPGLKYAIYGKNVPSYLFNNTNLQQYLKFNESNNSGYIANNEIPKDNTVLGLKWIDATAMFFRQSAGPGAYDASSLPGIVAPGDGTATPIWGDDEVVFCADPAEFKFWKVIEGHYPIPGSSIGAVSGDAMAMLGDITMARGMFAYAGIQPNPIGIDIYMGDNFLPFACSPGSIYQATVRFGS